MTNALSRGSLHISLRIFQFRQGVSLTQLPIQSRCLFQNFSQNCFYDEKLKLPDAIRRTWRTSKFFYNPRAIFFYSQQSVYF